MASASPVLRQVCSGVAGCEPPLGTPHPKGFNFPSPQVLVLPLISEVGFAEI